MYNDFELYTIEIINKKYNQLMVDNLQETQNIYLEDQNENKYIWLSHEYIEDELIVNKGFSKIILVKFNKEYNPLLEANKMVLQKIIINNEKTIELSIDL